MPNEKTDMSELRYIDSAKTLCWMTFIVSGLTVIQRPPVADLLPGNPAFLPSYLIDYQPPSTRPLLSRFVYLGR